MTQNILCEWLYPQSISQKQLMMTIQNCIYFRWWYDLGPEDMISRFVTLYYLKCQIYQQIMKNTKETGMNDHISTKMSAEIISKEVQMLDLLDKDFKSTLCLFKT
jgi:hypothetical protein